MKKILLSFDLEEFDVPLEYNGEIDKKDQFQVSVIGCENVLRILDEYKVRATFFVTAHFAENHQDLIKRIAQKHEIASHSYYHSNFNKEDLLRSRLKLEEISNQKVIGFRYPRLQPVDHEALVEAGYIYDSSINPTFLPGRYNHLDKPRTYYYSGKLLEIPVSVSPRLRFPLFWLAYKNLPSKMMNMFLKSTLKVDKYAALYFHPWEFTDIKKYKIPAYIKNICDLKMMEKLEYLISKNIYSAEFCSYSDFVDSISKIK